MKLFSFTGKHLNVTKPKFPRTRYTEIDSMHNGDPDREVYRKYSLFDKWHFEGVYNSRLSKPLD